MLQAKLKTVYKQKSKDPKQEPTFRAIYTIHGSSTDVATFVKNQGDYNRFDEDGITPLLWADAPENRTIGHTKDLNYWPDKNRYVVDFSDITMASGAIATVQKRGSSLLANAFASLEAADLRGRSTTSATEALESVETTETKADLSQPLLTSKK